MNFINKPLSFYRGIFLALRIVVDKIIRVSLFRPKWKLHHINFVTGRYTSTRSGRLKITGSGSSPRIWPFEIYSFVRLGYFFVYCEYNMKLQSILVFDPR